MRRNFPEEFSVSLCNLPRSVNTDKITIVLSDLNDYPRLTPLSRFVAVLILDLYMVPRLERRKLSGSPGKSLLHLELAETVRLSSGVCCLPPLLSREELARLQRQRVPKNSAKHDLGGTEASDRTRSISVDKQSLDQSISVQGASLGSVTTNQSLCVFDSELSSLVSSRVVSCRDPMDDSPVRTKILKDFRREDFSTITRECRGNPENRHVIPENFDHISAVVSCQATHCKPV